MPEVLFETNRGPRQSLPQTIVQCANLVHSKGIFAEIGGCPWPAESKKKLLFIDSGYTFYEQPHRLGAIFPVPATIYFKYPPHLFAVLHECLRSLLIHEELISFDGEFIPWKSGDKWNQWNKWLSIYLFHLVIDVAKNSK